MNIRILLPGMFQSEYSGSWAVALVADWCSWRVLLPSYIVWNGMLMIPVQQQEGIWLFCIVNTYSVTMGKNHCNIDYSYNQSTMRSHLEECFEKEELSLFPPSSVLVKMSRLITAKSTWLASFPGLGTRLARLEWPRMHGYRSFKHVGSRSHIN